MKFGPTFDPHQYRTDFPILSEEIHEGKPLVYLDNAATTQRPRQVIQKLVEVYEKYYANVHRGIHWLSDQSTDLYEEAREKVRVFLGASSRHEIIFTTGTTSGINLVARSWGDTHIGEGDEILLTVMEHHANLVPWQQLAERTGCVLRYVPITDDGQLRLEILDSLLTEKTRLFSFTAVSNVLGTINPVRELVARARQLGVVTLVDAAQSAPHDALNVQDLGADFVALSGHKMLGPSGVGVLYGREALLEAMPPFLGGGSMIRRVTLEGFEPAELPAKFEAGTPPIVSAIGLGAAIDYLNQVGMSAIHAHERLLTERAHEVLLPLGFNFWAQPPATRRGSSVLLSKGCMRTTWLNCWIAMVSRFARATTAQCRFTNGSGSPPAIGPAFISTTHWKKSNNWERDSAWHDRFFSAGLERSPKIYRRELEL